MNEKKVLLTIKSTQQYEDQTPEVIELTTGGTFRIEGDTCVLSYKETELTGLYGAVTTFTVSPERVVLQRDGAVSSRMEFVLNEQHESLYATENAALYIRVTAKKMQIELDENGGFFEVSYSVVIEQTTEGHITYHIDVQPLE
ncbi:MAG: DUF1934 domain-containing protein [Clostridia bacterium]|nr:DUF1934 domain-containing protein [Clostridia bacterium]